MSRTFIYSFIHSFIHLKNYFRAQPLRVLPTTKKSVHEASIKHNSDLDSVDHGAAQVVVVLFERIEFVFCFAEHLRQLHALFCLCYQTLLQLRRFFV